MINHEKLKLIGILNEYLLFLEAIGKYDDISLLKTEWDKITDNELNLEEKTLFSSSLL